MTKKLRPSVKRPKPATSSQPMTYFGEEKDPLQPVNHTDWHDTTSQRAGQVEQFNKDVLNKSVEEAIKARGLNVEKIPSPSFLVHSDGRQYDFQPLPGGEDVLITFRAHRRIDRYLLTVEEARQLWKKLRAKGYERF